MSVRLFVVIALLMGGVCMVEAKGTFEDLGVPVIRAGSMGCLIGPDPTGTKEWIYFNFNQQAAPLFIVAVDPETQEWRQYNAPEGPGAWGFHVGPDKMIYLGTWGGGLILRFDPAHPEKGIEKVGKPSATEDYLWMFDTGTDGKLYACTYPNAKLVSYDPKTGQMEDLGRMDETQMYSRSVAASKNGKIYVGIGSARANVVVYDPQTKQRKSILPEQYRKEGEWGTVMAGKDGNVYVRSGAQWFRADDETLTPIEEKDWPGSRITLEMKNGLVVTDATNTGYTLLDTKTNKSTTHKFQYKGAGSGIFMTAMGPEGKIYGSTAMPLEMFVYDPKTGHMEDLGNPTPVGGEIYSMGALDGLLYVCAYPGSWLSVYDPNKPWNYGTEPNSNPRGIGNIGDGHLRPGAMVIGPDKRIYIGSMPPYGQLGGAMGIYDPKQDKVVENYRNLIPNQSIFALAYEPVGGLIFGGSSIVGGGGSTPFEKEARLFAWNIAEKKKVIDLTPVPGDTEIAAIACARGKVFAVSRGSNTLTVYDPKERRIVHQAKMPVGTTLDTSLGLHKNGLLYGLTGSAIYTIDPKSYKVSKVAEYPKGIHRGFALTDDALYFACGVTLVRYKF
ncbi:MAG: hypothetical protein IT210_12300 [Armatimonadetes bacterium]|nr:hypothetical protein [Armatimonadota bacterium]